MILCASQDASHPILIKIRVTVTLQNKEFKIILKIDDSFHLSVKNTVATQLILLLGRVKKSPNRT
jgi:hypothetical protein